MLTPRPRPRSELCTDLSGQIEFAEITCNRKRYAHRRFYRDSLRASVVSPELTGTATRLDSRMLRFELPVDRGFRSVALHHPSLNLSIERRLMSDSPVETLPTQCAEFDLQHVEPAAVLGIFGAEQLRARSSVGPERRPSSSEATGRGRDGVKRYR
jgi:hypothetical protein